jgi:hypothetical protein
MSAGPSAIATSTHLLDTGIVLAFQKSGHLDALTDASSASAIAIVEEVYDEITDPRGGRHAAAAADARILIDGSKIQVVSVALGSIEAATLTVFRTGKSSASSDRGEAAFVRDGALGVERADEIDSAVQSLTDWKVHQPCWWRDWLTSARVSTPKT